MATGGYHAVVGEGVDDDNFVVDDREAGVEELFLPAGRDGVVECFGGDDSIVLFDRRRVASGGMAWGLVADEFVIEAFGGGGVSDAAAYEQVGLSS
jgi:hypothetical protein